MSLVEKNNIQNAVRDLLDLIDKANEMIILHQSPLSPDQLIIFGYEKQRLQFLHQLNNLLANYQIRVDFNNKAA